jgi:hypothetical protein
MVRSPVDSCFGMSPSQAAKSRPCLKPPPLIAAPHQHAQLVEVDERFHAAMAEAIVAGGERVEAMYATVDVKRRTKRDRT